MKVGQSGIVEALEVEETSSIAWSTWASSKVLVFLFLKRPLSEIRSKSRSKAVPMALRMNEAAMISVAVDQ